MLTCPKLTFRPFFNVSTVDRNLDEDSKNYIEFMVICNYIVQRQPGLHETLPQTETRTISRLGQLLHTYGPNMHNCPLSFWGY